MCALDKKTQDEEKYNRYMYVYLHCLDWYFFVLFGCYAWLATYLLLLDVVCMWITLETDYT